MALLQRKNNSEKKFTNVILAEVVSSAKTSLIDTARENDLFGSFRAHTFRKDWDDKPNKAIESLLYNYSKLHTTYTDIILASSLCNLFLTYPSPFIHIRRVGKKYNHPDIYINLNPKDEPSDPFLRNIYVMDHLDYDDGDKINTRVDIGLCGFFTKAIPIRYLPESAKDRDGAFYLAIDDDKGKTIDLVLSKVRNAAQYIPLEHRIQCRNALFNIWSSPFAMKKDISLEEFLNHKLNLCTITTSGNGNCLYNAIYIGKYLLASLQKNLQQQKDPGVGIPPIASGTLINDSNGGIKIKEELWNYVKKNAGVVAHETTPEGSGVLDWVRKHGKEIFDIIKSYNAGVQPWFHVPETYMKTESAKSFFRHIGHQYYPRIDLFELRKHVVAEVNKSRSKKLDATTDITEFLAVNTAKTSNYEQLLYRLRNMGNKGLKYGRVLDSIGACDTVALHIILLFDEGFVGKNNNGGGGNRSGVDMGKNTPLALQLSDEQIIQRAEKFIYKCGVWGVADVLWYIVAAFKIDILFFYDLRSVDQKKHSVNRTLGYSVFQYHGQNRSSDFPMMIVNRNSVHYEAVSPCDDLRQWPTFSQLIDRLKFFFRVTRYNNNNNNGDVQAAVNSHDPCIYGELEGMHPHEYDVMLDNMLKDALNLP